MSRKTVSAYFESPRDAEAAMRRLRELGVPDESMRIAAGRALHAELYDVELDRVLEILEQSRAVENAYGEEEPGPGWLGHFAGRVTGTRVPPGQGDSEAGSSVGSHG